MSHSNYLVGKVLRWLRIVVRVAEPPRPVKDRKWDRLHRRTSQRLGWSLEKGWQLRDEAAA